MLNFKLEGYVRLCSMEAPVSKGGGQDLEQLLEGLDQSELQVLWQAPHVVVALDGVAVLLAAARGRA